MLSQAEPFFSANPEDAEFEWLLCLAAAVQARERPEKSAPEGQPPPQPNLRSRLQALLKGLRGGQGIGVV
jgi:hypothetical protein